MAGRPPKESIDYAGWDVNIFDGIDKEKKIDKLIEAQGCQGFTIYFYLCQRAYGSYGYYYPWCSDDATSDAKRLGGGVGAKAVIETVKFCLQVGLFDKRLFEGWEILTSNAIQKQFVRVAQTRTNRTVIQEYWLLSERESRGLVPCTQKTDYLPRKLNYEDSKSNLSDSRVEYSKLRVEERESNTPPHAKKEDLKSEIIERFGQGVYEQYLAKTKAYSYTEEIAHQKMLAWILEDVQRGKLKPAHRATSFDIKKAEEWLFKDVYGDLVESGAEQQKKEE